jgi:hypothetical protein
MSQLLYGVYQNKPIDITLVQHTIRSNDINTLHTIICLLLSPQRQLGDIDVIIEYSTRDYLGINMGPQRISGENSFLFNLTTLSPIILDVLYIIRNNSLNTIGDYLSALKRSPVQKKLKSFNHYLHQDDYFFAQKRPSQNTQINPQHAQTNVDIGLTEGRDNDKSPNTVDGGLNQHYVSYFAYLEHQERLLHFFHQTQCNELDNLQDRDRLTNELFGVDLKTYNERMIKYYSNNDENKYKKPEDNIQTQTLSHNIAQFTPSPLKFLQTLTPQQIDALLYVEFYLQLLLPLKYNPHPQPKNDILLDNNKTHNPTHNNFQNLPPSPPITPPPEENNLTQYYCDQIHYWLVPSITTFFETISSAHFSSYLDYYTHLISVLDHIITISLVTSRGELLTGLFSSFFALPDLGFSQTVFNDLTYNLYPNWRNTIRGNQTSLLTSFQQGLVKKNTRGKERVEEKNGGDSDRCNHGQKEMVLIVPHVADYIIDPVSGEDEVGIIEGEGKDGGKLNDKMNFANSDKSLKTNPFYNYSINNEWKLILPLYSHRQVMVQSVYNPWNNTESTPFNFQAQSIKYYNRDMFLKEYSEEISTTNPRNLPQTNQIDSPRSPHFAPNPKLTRPSPIDIQNDVTSLSNPLLKLLTERFVFAEILCKKMSIQLQLFELHAVYPGLPFTPVFGNDSHISKLGVEGGGVNNGEDSERGLKYNCEVINANNSLLTQLTNIDTFCSIYLFYFPLQFQSTVSLFLSYGIVCSGPTQIYTNPSKCRFEKDIFQQIDKVSDIEIQNEFNSLETLLQPRTQNQPRKKTQSKKQLLDQVNLPQYDPKSPWKTDYSFLKTALNNLGITSQNFVLFGKSGRILGEGFGFLVTMGLEFGLFQMCEVLLEISPFSTLPQLLSQYSHLDIFAQAVPTCGTMITITRPWVTKLMEFLIHHGVKFELFEVQNRQEIDQFNEFELLEDQKGENKTPRFGQNDSTVGTQNRPQQEERPFLVPQVNEKNFENVDLILDTIDKAAGPITAFELLDKAIVEKIGSFAGKNIKKDIPCWESLLGILSIHNSSFQHDVLFSLLVYMFDRKKFELERVNEINQKTIAKFNKKRDKNKLTDLPEEGPQLLPIPIFSDITLSLDRWLDLLLTQLDHCVAPNWTTFVIIYKFFVDENELAHHLEQQHRHEKNSENPTPSWLDQLFDRLFTILSKQIAFFGVNEPILHPNCIKYLNDNESSSEGKNCNPHFQEQFDKLNFFGTTHISILNNDRENMLYAQTNLPTHSIIHSLVFLQIKQIYKRLLFLLFPPTMLKSHFKTILSTRLFQFIHDINCPDLLHYFLSNHIHVTPHLFFTLLHTQHPKSYLPSRDSYPLLLNLTTTILPTYYSDNNIVIGSDADLFRGIMGDSGIIQRPQLMNILFPNKTFIIDHFKTVPQINPTLEYLRILISYGFNLTSEASLEYLIQPLLKAICLHSSFHLFQFFFLCGFIPSPQKYLPIYLSSVSFPIPIQIYHSYLFHHFFTTLPLYQTLADNDFPTLQHLLLETLETSVYGLKLCFSRMLGVDGVVTQTKNHNDPNSPKSSFKPPQNTHLVDLSSTIPRVDTFQWLIDSLDFSTNYDIIDLNSRDTITQTSYTPIQYEDSDEYIKFYQLIMTYLSTCYFGQINQQVILSLINSLLSLGIDIHTSLPNYLYLYHKIDSTRGVDIPHELTGNGNSADTLPLLYHFLTYPTLRTVDIVSLSYLHQDILPIFHPKYFRPQQLPINPSYRKAESNLLSKTDQQLSSIPYHLEPPDLFTYLVQQHDSTVFSGTYQLISTLLSEKLHRIYLMSQNRTNSSSVQLNMLTQDELGLTPLMHCLKYQRGDIIELFLTKNNPFSITTTLPNLSTVAVGPEGEKKEVIRNKRSRNSSPILQQLTFKDVFSRTTLMHLVTHHSETFEQASLTESTVQTLKQIIVNKYHKLQKDGNLWDFSPESSNNGIKNRGSEEEAGSKLNDQNILLGAMHTLQQYIPNDYHLERVYLKQIQRIFNRIDDIPDRNYNQQVQQKDQKDQKDEDNSNNDPSFLLNPSPSINYMNQVHFRPKYLLISTIIPTNSFHWFVRHFTLMELKTMKHKHQSFFDLQNTQENFASQGDQNEQGIDKFHLQFPTDDNFDLLTMFLTATRQTFYCLYNEKGYNDNIGTFPSVSDQSPSNNHNNNALGDDYDEFYGKYEYIPGDQPDESVLYQYMPPLIDIHSNVQSVQAASDMENGLNDGNRDVFDDNTSACSIM